jgi:hypothetical protein
MGHLVLSTVRPFYSGKAIHDNLFIQSPIRGAGAKPDG